MTDVRDHLREWAMPHVLCPGCAHGIVLRSFLEAVDQQGIDPDKLAMVAGIGCSSRLVGYVDFCTLHGTHGRAPAFATGLKLARPDLEVVVITGDGDGLAIGGNHLIHAARRNIDITVLLLNNSIYGMTGGQGSPTTSLDRYTTTTPLGNHEPAFDACELATAAGAGLVGREVTMQVPSVKDLIKEGISHPGFAFIEIISDCTEIYGRKNDLGSSAEMVLSQKKGILPTYIDVTDVDAVEQPFRPGSWQTGVLSKNERPEYYEAYMDYCRQGGGNSQSRSDDH